MKNQAVVNFTLIVARDINAKHLRSEFCRGYCRRAIATAKVQNLEAQLTQGTHLNIGHDCQVM